MKKISRNEFVLLIIKIAMLLVALYTAYVIYVKISISWKGIFLLILLFSTMLIVRSIVTTFKNIYAKYTKDLSIRSLAFLNTLGLMFNFTITLLAGAMLYKGYLSDPTSTIATVVVIFVMVSIDHYKSLLKDPNAKS